MSKQLPKFLTRELAEGAIQVAVTTAFDSFPVKRLMLHVVVLAPEMIVIDDNWPMYPIKPYSLAEKSFGEKADWPHKFDEIAQCKALQLWHGRNNGSAHVVPHLLFPGDTHFWGGVRRDGIVVACSGVQPYFDRMIAGMTADICIALSYHAYTLWMQENQHVDFLD